MILIVLSIVGMISLLVLLILTIRFKKGKRKTEEYNENSNIAQIENLGSTKHLKITPLVDWYKENEELKREGGSSYLIETDKQTILFDTGKNTEDEHPSPLLHNMDKLNLSLFDIDSIVISHNHLDHVGGLKWNRKKTFSLTSHQIDLGEKDIYTPTPMSYPGLEPICSKNPTKISEGVCTTGTTANQLFLLGWIEEQALAVNVEGKGIVLIVGCGHQTVTNIMEKAEKLFNQPIYGIVGGLHFPVTGGRGNKIFEIFQKYGGIDKLPWKRNKIGDVRITAEYMKDIGLQVVGLSAHDSCDESINIFKNVFKDYYNEVMVGKTIVVN